MVPVVEDLKELYRFRELLFTMVHRDLQIRYKNSVIGFFWSLINPLATMVVLTIVFKYLLKNGIENYSAYVLAAQLPFLFFQQSLMDASQSVLTGAQIMRKVYFPREIYPLASIIANFIHFIFSIGAFFFYLILVWLVFRGHFPIQVTVLYLPIILFINFCLNAGLGLLFAALNTLYEDVKFILGIVLYLGFFLCPIIYFSERVYYAHVLPQYPNLVYRLYMANPMAALVTIYRKVLLPLQPVFADGEMRPALPLDWWMIGILAVFSVFVLWLGYHVFNRMKWKFLEKP